MPGSTQEHVLYETRRHGIVLAGSIFRALALAGAGAFLIALGWPYSLGGVLAMALAAFAALRSVWRWDRTKLVITSERLYVVFGVLRRRSAVVRLPAVGAVEVEQTLTGRIFGYGTLIVGELEVDYLPEPAELCGLVAHVPGL